MYSLSDARILLAGEATDQRVNDPRYAVSPIFVDKGNGAYEVGSCFFISESGIFVTAKHILESSYSQEIPDEHKNYVDEPFDPSKKIDLGARAFIPQFLPGNSFLNRTVQAVALASNDDVAVGVVNEVTTSNGKSVPTVPLVLSARDSKVGDTVFTFAYPGTDRLSDRTHASFNLHPVASIGVVNEHYPNGRDCVLIPNPCYQTSISTSAGSSGGPVFNMLGAVVGINTSGLDSSTHFVSKISAVSEMHVPDADFDSATKIEELLETGHIAAYAWDSSGSETTNVNYALSELRVNLGTTQSGQGVW